MILIELVFPMVLLILGIYHGMMQVLYRSGMIHSRKVFEMEYFQGSATLHCRCQRDCFHDILRGRVRLCRNSFLPGARSQHEGRRAVVRVDDNRHVARSRSHTLREGERALHVLSAAEGAPGILRRTRNRRRRFVDRVLQLVASLTSRGSANIPERKCRSPSSASLPRSSSG